MRCAAGNAGSDPWKTCGFPAQWVFLRHTHRAGSLPAKSSFQEGGIRHPGVTDQGHRGPPAVPPARQERAPRPACPTTRLDTDAPV